MADYFSISKGSQANLAGKARRAGQICYTTDESVLYVDIAGTDAINRQAVNAKSSFGLPFASAGTSAQDFVATISNLKEIVPGTTIILYNNTGSGNSANATLKLNGATTGTPIYYQGAKISANKWPNHSVGLFVYNTTELNTGCWSMVYSYGANTTYSPNSLGFGYGTCTTDAATAAKIATLSGYGLVNGGIVAIKFTNAVTSSSTTLNINNRGAKAIYFKGAALGTNVIKAGDLVTFMYDGSYYHILAIDRAQTVADATKGTLTFTGKSGNKTFNGASNVTIGYNDVNALPSTTVWALGSSQGGNAATADKTKAALTIGSKTFNGSSAVTVTAADLGLSQALVFKGVSKTAISDGLTTKTITLSNDSSLTAATGYVVLYGEHEYVWTGSAWERLGGDGSYALNSISITGANGLTGGGNLTENRTISHATKTVTSSAASSAPTSYISALTVDSYGHLATYTTYDARAQFLRSISVTADSPINVSTTSLAASASSTPSTKITHAQVAGTKIGSTGECATSIGAGGSGTINVPNITVDAYGHTVFNGNKAISISIPNPAAKLTVASSASAAGANTYSVEYTPTGAAKSITFYAMKGATSSAAGFQGFVPQPAAGAQVKFLRGDGTWQFPVEWEDF